MKIGYIRVSTREQNTIRQEYLMESLGVDEVYIDRMSGRNTDRPELKKMLDYVRRGDTVIVESISRFARNTRDLLDLTEKLSAKGVEFVSQKENIDTTTPPGNSCSPSSALWRSWSESTSFSGSGRALQSPENRASIKEESLSSLRILTSWSAGGERASSPPPRR